MFKHPSHSREHQDFFVLAMLNKKRGGTYLEIGGAQPQQGNNTHLLESVFGWRGVSVEWSGDLASRWPGQRVNPCICADATLLDYDALLQAHGLGPHIDYLQLDIDPPHQTLSALLRINLFKYRFSVITYEHDLYNGGDFERLASRRILESFGYRRVVSDVLHGEFCFEDWYVHPAAVSAQTYGPLLGERVTLDAAHLDPRYAEHFLHLGL